MDANVDLDMLAIRFAFARSQNLRVRHDGLFCVRELPCLILSFRCC